MLNPHSAGGRTGRAAQVIARALERHFAPLTVAPTTAPGDAERITREALRAGVERIVAVGGDGTIGEVVNGFFDAGAPVNGDAELALVELGTGGDLRRNFGLPGRLHPALERVATGTVRAIDVGRVLYTTPGGSRRERYFANVASFGLTADVATRANRATGWRYRTGSLVYVWAAIAELLRPERHRVRLALDGAAPEEVELVLVAVCNGAWFGGGMHVAPGAAPDDGLLDVVLVLGASTPRLFGAFARVFRGTHLKLPCVRHVRARSIVVEPVASAGGPARIEVDGETPAAFLPARFEVIPGAIRLRA